MPTAAVVGDGEVQWGGESLSERLGRAWRDMRRGAAAELLGAHLYGRLGEPDAIEAAHLDVLDILGRHDGRRMSELAAALHVDPSTVTRTMHRMEAAGLARRAAAPSDRRVVIAHITDEGRRVHARIAARRTALIDAAFEELAPDERERLVDLLERFVASVARNASGARTPAG